LNYQLQASFGGTWPMTLESSMIPVSMKKKKTGFGAARPHFSCTLRQFLSAYTAACTAGCLVKTTERASFATLGRVPPRASASLQPVVGGPVAKTRRWPASHSSRVHAVRLPPKAAANAALRRTSGVGRQVGNGHAKPIKISLTAALALRPKVPAQPATWCHGAQPTCARRRRRRRRPILASATPLRLGAPCTGASNPPS
jgi:hypothetical protein